jgi:hypothetical protein
VHISSATVTYRWRSRTCLLPSHSVFLRVKRFDRHADGRSSAWHKSSLITCLVGPGTLSGTIIKSIAPVQMPPRKQHRAAAAAAAAEQQPSSADAGAAPLDCSTAAPRVEVAQVLQSALLRELASLGYERARVPFSEQALRLWTSELGPLYLPPHKSRKYDLPVTRPLQQGITLEDIVSLWQVRPIARVVRGSSRACCVASSPRAAATRARSCPRCLRA